MVYLKAYSGGKEAHAALEAYVCSYNTQLLDYQRRN